MSYGDNFSEYFVASQIEKLEKCFVPTEIDQLVKEEAENKAAKLRTKHQCVTSLAGLILVASAVLAPKFASVLTTPSVHEIKQNQYRDSIIKSAIHDGFDPLMADVYEPTKELLFDQQLGHCILLVNTEAITSVQPVGSTLRTQQYVVTEANVYNHGARAKNFQEVEKLAVFSSCTIDK